MKISYLITAHNQPYHLHRMVDALNTQDTNFLIHLDKKSNLADFEPQTYPDNVIFIENRIKINHGGFSLVEAMIQLINTAVNMDDFDYCQFLSGWDYPIKNNQYIHEYLSQNYPMNFMNFYRLSHTADFIANITKYHFVDLINNSPQVIQKPLKAVQYAFKNISYNRPFFDDMVPYRGSTWFCLNKTTMYYINHFLNTEKGKRYHEFFRNVLCGDEIFFTTLVMNSPFAEFCRFYDRDIKSAPKNENNAYLHYIDWNQQRENPAVFDMSDLSNLMSTSALYARKFTETKSAKLLEEIDHQLAMVHA